MATLLTFFFDSSLQMLLLEDSRRPPLTHQLASRGGFSHQQSTPDYIRISAGQGSLPSRPSNTALLPCPATPPPGPLRLQRTRRPPLPMDVARADARIVVPAAKPTVSVGDKRRTLPRRRVHAALGAACIVRRAAEKAMRVDLERALISKRAVHAATCRPLLALPVGWSACLQEAASRRSGCRP